MLIKKNWFVLGFILTFFADLAISDILWIQPHFYLILLNLYIYFNKEIKLDNLWVIGLLKDIASLGRMGLNSIFFLIYGLILVKLKKWLFIRNIAIWFCLIFVLNLFILSTEFVFTLIFAGDTAYAVFSDAIYTSIISYLLVEGIKLCRKRGL